MNSSVSFVAKDDEIFRVYHEPTMNTQFIIWQVMHDIYLLYYSLYSDKKVLYQLQSKCDLTFVMLIFYIYSNNGQYLNIIITMYSFKL